MLVLSRKKNQSIVIRDDINVEVLDIRGNVVRFGIDAPKEVPVHRGEVYAAIQEERAKAARLQPEDTGKANPGNSTGPGGYELRDLGITNNTLRGYGTGGLEIIGQ